ncbi:MAG TPA: uroporphyrinogen-III synthase, partial [Coxiellaceae bacterium]|nr:uroporphyrinogen-III synthase [Coxiellaceae bacterium]
HGDIPLSTICLAIGEGTADAMEKAGIPVAARPTLFSSEGLLELPELQHVDQQSIAIITGENSRGLLKKALIQRGAKVKEYGVYRRQCPVVTPEQIKQLIQTSIHAIIITSQESLSNLIHMLGEKNCPWLFQQSLLVIHPKIEAYAREMGFQNTIGVAKNPTAKALLDELKI